MTKLLRDFDWFWIAFLTALVWLWQPLWAGSQIPAFRDGFHFYYPQFHWLDSCYQSGEYFPRWNPNEGLGASVWGQPTWQIFYPLRLLWLLPLQGLPQLYALWIILHQIIAALGMKRLAYELGLARKAGWLAGIAYSLGCPVLFQYSNAVYLCSAAWIGWALIPVVRILILGLPKHQSELQPGDQSGNRGRLFWQVADLASQFGTACAMMVLSGDPHTAVNAMIVGAACSAFLTFRFWASRSLHRSRTIVTHEGQPQESGYPGKVAIQAGSDAGPARKGRAIDSLQPIFAVRGLTIAAIFLLFALQVNASWKWFQVSSRSHQPPRVSDSVSPRLAAILSENSALTSHRVFEFSISPSALPSLLWPTLGGFYQPVHSRWVDSLESEGRMWIPSLYMGVIVVLMGVDRWRNLISKSATGVWRPVELFFLGITLFALLAATGILYGLVTWIVPGYDSFRYPAKWIVWASAGLSLSAAFHFEQRPGGPSHPLWPRLPRLGLGMIALGIIACLSFITWQNTDLQAAFSRWLSLSYDRLLGSANAEQSIQEILFALHWPLVVLCVLGTSFLILPKRCQSTVMLLVCLLDLCGCGRHWITTTAVPKPDLSSPAGRSSDAYWSSIRKADIRKLRTVDMPNDQAAQIELQQRFLTGKLGHLANIATYHASGSLKPWAVVKIERWLLQNDSFQEEQNELDEVLSHLGVSHRLFQTSAAEFQWKNIKSVRPLCEVVNDERRPTSTQETASNTRSQVEWKWIGNSRLQVNVEIDRDCTLMIRQFNDGGWRADCPSINQLSPKQGELFLLFRVPEGKHTLRLSRRAF